MNLSGKGHILKRYKYVAALFTAVAMTLSLLVVLPATAVDTAPIGRECIDPPSIKEVVPNTGSPDGGETVDVMGNCFEKEAIVTFDRNEAKVVEYSPNRITVIVPKHDPGAVDIFVTNPGQRPMVLKKGYTYLDARLKQVLYNANGGVGTLIDPRSPYEVGSKVEVLRPEGITRDGYNFVNWNTQSDGGGDRYQPGDGFEIRESITLYAMWDQIPPPVYTVTFNGNGATGGSMTPQSASIPTALSLNAFTRDGFVFESWNTAANNGGVTYVDGATYNFDVSRTLYAHWRAVPPTPHTVTFYGNGATGGSMTPQTASAPTALTANAFSVSGYNFAGWNTSAAGTGTPYANSATYSFAADIALYAQWTLIPPTPHTVTFVGNGATGGSTDSQTASTATALRANGFTKTGYNFDHWNTAADNSGVSYTNGAIYSFAADITLYARWSTIPTYTITFNANGGTGTMANQVSSTPAVISTNTFTRSGFNFVGWLTTPTGGTHYAVGTIYPFTSDLTLYAEWSAIMVAPPINNGGGSAPVITTPVIRTVTFSGNGATSGSMATQSSDKPVPLNKLAFTRPGYNFDHWSTKPDVDGTLFHDQEIFPFYADTVLYAHWSLREIKQVTFGSNGPAITSVTFQSGINPTPLLANPILRSGYTFKGWNTSSDGSGINFPDGAAYSFDSDLKLYAQWSLIPFQSASLSATKPLVLALASNQAINLRLTINNVDGSNTPATVQIPQGLVGLDSTIRITPVATVESILLGIVSLQVEVLDEFGGLIPELRAPLTMQLTNNFGDYVVAQSSDGFIWTPLPQLKGTTLSDGVLAGYYYDADGLIVVVTAHLTQFGLRKQQGSQLKISQPSKAAALNTALILTNSGGNGSGPIRYSTTTPNACAVTAIGVVKAVAAGTCTVTAVKGGDAIYLNSNTAVLSIAFKAAAKKKK